MSYDSDDRRENSRRTSGEPHPDWERNRDYISSQLQSDFIKKKLQAYNAGTHWDGVQKTGTYMEYDPKNPKMPTEKSTFEVLTSFWVTWETLNLKNSHPFSLHQDTNKLIEEWEKFFGIKGGPISKRGIYQP